MKNINNNELKEIKGGGVNWGLMAGIGAVASFLIGVIDGLINPKKCNSQNIRGGISRINLDNNKLKEIKGGASGISSAVLNALMRTVSVMFSVGQAVGSAIRRAVNKNYC